MFHNTSKSKHSAKLQLSPRDCLGLSSVRDVIKGPDAVAESAAPALHLSNPKSKGAGSE